MAIKPPSDIVLDVVRAADPTRRQAAVEKLTGMPGAESNAHEFASLVGGVKPAGQAGACGQSMARPGGEKVPDAYRSFEAFFIQSFVESMLPKSSETNYGSGTAGEVWRSQLAEKIGGEIAENGGIGIADRLQSQQAKSEAGIASLEDESGAGFSLADSLSNAAPFAGWASYLPFLPSRAPVDSGEAASGDQVLPVDDA